PSWASTSIVTSTMVVAVETAVDGPNKVAARAPMTKPPICDSGSTSEPESRTSRPQTKARKRRDHPPAGAEQQIENELIEEDDRKTAPADRAERGEHLAEPEISDDRR